MEGVHAVRRRAWLRPAALSVLTLGLVAIVGVAIWQARIDRASGNALTIVLAIAALSAGGLVVQAIGGMAISPLWLVGLLAAAFLGPTSACAAGALGELGAQVRRRSQHWSSILFNLVAEMAPGLAAANLIRALAPSNTTSAAFYFVIAGAGVVYLVVNALVVSGCSYVFRGAPLNPLRMFSESWPSIAINVALAVAGAAIYVELGTAGIAFALAALFAFAYEARLLDRSRQRTEQYVSLSWGVLAGLMRSLDIRDRRAARHAAAVARFARDMAESVGMNKQDQELAHTAGLLHDIGHFALSDRVAERGRPLQEEDWMAIQRHPELGADMLRDLGMYGPVAEIVLAHHERIDGRGYPKGLPADEIPELAKMIAVAEVYDTLTASDTYRTPMSSFEALRELRRVAGSQLDSHYVEVLAGLLSGEGTEYRHADAADFDVELAMERRIKEARA